MQLIKASSATQVTFHSVESGEKTNCAMFWFTRLFIKSIYEVYRSDFISKYQVKYVQFMYHTFHTVLFGSLTAAIAEAQF